MLHWILTGLALVLCLSFAVYSNWKAGLPWDDAKPRVLPWRLIMILSAFAAFLVIVHALNLAGFETGPEHSLLGRGF